MIKHRLTRILPFTLAGVMLLNACSEKSDCVIPTRHVHKYTKQVTDDIGIETYLDNENLQAHGYNWNENYIEINKVDEAIYKLLNSKLLFEGSTNWDYLFNYMASFHDYLKYYYYYETKRLVEEKDSEGNVISSHYVTDKHDGWTTNPYDANNTGKVRLYHHRFFGYRIVCENGKFRLDISNNVDDIRDVIREYPYFGEDCVASVYETFYFSKYDLYSLTPEDFDVFVGPNLDNPNLELGMLRERS